MDRKRAKGEGTESACGQERYVDTAFVREFLGGVSDMTLWRWEREHDFPSPIKLGGGGRNSWWLPDVVDWARARAARDNQPRAAKGRHQHLAAECGEAR